MLWHFSHRNEVTLDNEEKDSRELSTVVLDSTKCMVVNTYMVGFSWYHNWMLYVNLVISSSSCSLQFSFLTFGNYQKSLCSIDYITSSKWIEPQEWKFIMTVLNNIGVSLYDFGHLGEAAVTYEMLEARYPNIYREI